MKFNIYRLLIGALIALSIGGAHLRAEAAEEPTLASNGTVAMILTPIAEPEHKPHEPTHRPDISVAPWNGLLNLSIRNVSRAFVTVDEGMWTKTYGVSLLDDSGKPAPLTEYGKVIERDRRAPDPLGYQGPAIRRKLAPGEETITKVDLSQVFQVIIGVSYTLQISPTSGLPKNDEKGKPISPAGLSCILRIDGSGITR